MGTLTSTNIRSPLFSRKQSGGVFSVVNETLTTGNIYYVDSGQTTTGGTTSGYGRNPDAPFTTLAAALAQCTAANGDMIFLMPGHAETITVSVSLAKAGVSIIGLGNGDNRPTFTVNAAVDGFSVMADDIRISNARFVTGASVTSRSRLIRVAASDIEINKCRFEITAANAVSHAVVTISGDNIQILNSEFIGADTTRSDVNNHTAVLNTLATRVVVKGCRFDDSAGAKGQGWKACCEGGGISSNMLVEDCTFICHGIATRTRSAAASDGGGAPGGGPTLVTAFCRAISPSAHTAAAAIFTPTYQYILESYVVAAVNVQSLHATSTSDIRMKTGVAYL